MTRIFTLSQCILLFALITQLPAMDGEEENPLHSRTNSYKPVSFSPNIREEKKDSPPFLPLNGLQFFGFLGPFYYEIFNLRK